MAKNLADDRAVESANRTHNSDERKKIIRECADQWKRIREARQELNEHAKEMRERLRDIEVNVPAFEHTCRLREKEEEARDTYLDAIRECFKALGVGAQGSLFVVGDAAE